MSRMEGFLSPSEAEDIWLPPVLHPFRRSDVIASYLGAFGVETLPKKADLIPKIGPSCRMAVYTRRDLIAMANEYARFEQGAPHPAWLPPEGPAAQPIMELPAIPETQLEIIPQGELING